MSAKATIAIGDVVKTKHPKTFNLNYWTYEYLDAVVVGIWKNYAILRRDKRYAPFLETIKKLEKNIKEANALQTKPARATGHE